ncbi:hypothetical protein NXS19_008832 [Fusarium pseudograminearum]|nr:hypothetical protein NXS19_008832 [Fusarium pseudograminearum]
MMLRSTASWAFLAAAVRPAVSQFDNWQDGQISSGICTWEQPRGNNAGIILNFNMSTPFNATTNVTAILLHDPAMSKARGGSGNSNSAAPNFIDGALLGNDDEFFLYGGDLLQTSEKDDSPAKDEILGYEAYQYGPDKPTWNPGFVDPKLDENVTRYVAYGGAVNVPSEDLAFYFSGLRSPTKGEFFTNDQTRKQPISLIRLLR